MQFHILSFEGPDLYSRAGGLATRVVGLADSLAALGFETHLWFVGDPALPGRERRGRLVLHRWCQWVSAHHSGGVYAGEVGKHREYTASLPPHVLEVLEPHLRGGGRATILAEEWQTADALLSLHALLGRAGLRDRASLLWNANNTFGFDAVAWPQLRQAAHITTVSRYMKHCLRAWGVEAIVVPNGLAPEAFLAPDRAAVAALRQRHRDRMVLVKIARFDPDKRWLETIGLVAELKAEGWRPLLVARGGAEAHGHAVRAAARARGLRLEERDLAGSGSGALVAALSDVDAADVVELRAHVSPEARLVLYRAADAVLANSGHEPFGFVGLETMAASGLAVTGNSGEDYVVPGHNALVLETGEPGEFMSLYGRLRAEPERLRALRRAGRATALRYAWPEVVERILLPRVELAYRGPRRVLPLLRAS